MRRIRRCSLGLERSWEGASLACERWEEGPLPWESQAGGSLGSTQKLQFLGASLCRQVTLTGVKTAQVPRKG